MPKIEFRGKIYNNEFEMPPEERRAYNEEKERDAGKTSLGSKPLSEVVDMPPEVRAIYERAVDNVERELSSSQPQRDLPTTDDIYRQSAPDEMKNMPSDESIYRPSRPLLDQTNPSIEPEPALGINRLMVSLLWAFIVAATIFIITQFLL